MRASASHQQIALLSLRRHARLLEISRLKVGNRGRVQIFSDSGVDLRGGQRRDFALQISASQRHGPAELLILRQRSRQPLRP